MDAYKIRTLLLIVASAFVALYLGVMAATNQMQTVAWVVGSSFIIFCFALGRKIWIFSQFLTAIGLVLYYVPGKPDTNQIGQFILIAFTALQFLARRLNYRLKFGELEVWCLLFIACVVQAYVRNPVGIDALGSDRVGGRPYFDFGITLLSSFIISSLIVEAKEIRLMWKFTILGMLISAIFGAIGYYVPRIGYWLGNSSGAGLDGSETANEGDSASADRKPFSGVLGKTIALLVSSYRSPLKSLIHPFFAFIMLLSVIAAAYSGYRNHIAMVGLTYLVAIFYRSGVMGVFVSVMLGLVGVAVVSIVNSIIPLPPNIQRAMTIFPGSWEQRYIDDAEGSTEWRVEMWIEALTNKRYISNTFLGDGLGMTREQLQRSNALSEMKNVNTTSGFNVHRENAMLSGAYHSGPVSMIRTCGYLGLAIWLCAMFFVLKNAHMLALNSRHSEWYPLVLFFMIPIIWGPIFWIFIYGTFSGAAGMLFSSVAMIRLLSSNLGIEMRRVSHY